MRRAGVMAAAVMAGGLCAGVAMSQTSAEEKPALTLGEQVEGALAKLDWLVGEFEAKGTYGGPKPDGTRDEQKGTWKNGRILGGRHLQMTFDVEVAGRRVEYVCVLSWNPREARYETVWVGSSGYRFAEVGTYDEKTRTLTLISEQVDGRTGAPHEVKSVFRLGVNEEITVTDTREIDGQAVVSFYAELRRKK